ncbi:MAG TPA: ion transporter [Candidatus Limnocylindria bacterium]|jgi:voltage-gated potassium channel|nr:ion transporter [Candidatus Limnocylindria bacterium]
MTEDERDARREATNHERWQLLRSLDTAMEKPLVVLAFAWLAVLLLEFVVGTDTRLEVAFYAIWIVFIAEVVIKLVIAPDRPAWLRQNWLKVASLLIPALRALRVFVALRFLRAGQAVRSAGLLRLLTSVNRGIGAIGRTLDRARFAYVTVISVMVILVGAAGMLFFEQGAVPAGTGAVAITTYGDALWWTGMTMTTVGSDYSPFTAEGRLLGWLLSVYAIGVFGYVTATVASHLLGVGGVPGAAASADRQLHAEVAALRAQLAALNARLGDNTSDGQPAC